MGLGLGLCCCGGCDCLTYQAGSYYLDPHIRFDSAGIGVHIGCARQADLTIWRGVGAVSAFVSSVMGVRVPVTGEPRLIYLYNPATTALASADFDALGSRPGVLFECQSNVWTLLESNDFTYLGTPITASTAAVDGIACLPLTTPVAPDAVWCNPSYIPDTIQCTFGSWQNENVGIPGSERRRANFNGVPMAIPLSSTTISGSRTIRNYGTGSPVYFYSDATVLCNGLNQYPQDTIRWQLSAQTNTATVPDGTASQTWVRVVENFTSAADAFGCYNFTTLRNWQYKWLSTFDVLDDTPGVTHWIKKGDTSTSPAIPDGLHYQTTTSAFSASAAAIGNLLRVFP